MLHGPCGTINPKCPCMQDGKCSKDFPKLLRQKTTIGEDCYPHYRRRSPAHGGHTTKLFVSSTKTEVTMDNRNVVPYNPWLSLRYQAHINVEYCASIKAIKYLYKYVYKGSDRATITMVRGDDRVDLDVPQTQNEPQQYESKRYVGASEASWRLLDFPIQV